MHDKPISDESTKTAPPGVMSSNPEAALALLAAGTGAIALVSIAVEVWTGQSMARTANLGVAYLSAPLGVGTLILAGLSARLKPLWSLPAIVMCAIYWAIFAFAG